jgi:cytidylate kinase
MQPDHVTETFAHETQLEQCHDYILRQLQVGKKPSAVRDLPPPGPAITISYQTGSGEHEVAKRLAEILQAAEPQEKIRWTVFDRRLVEKVLEDHHLPQSLAMTLEEDRRTYIQDVMEEFGGIRPPSWVVVRQVAETVLHLAAAGHVILVGRGANFITARMPNVFHVHLIASLPKRIARVQKLNDLTPEEAAKFVAGSDRGRGRYVKAHFHVRIDDDLLYHLAINTDRMPCPEAAQLIADGARRCFQSGGGGKK